MEESVFIDFLQSFFALFKARIEHYKISKERISGVIGWLNEEDKQPFLLNMDFDCTSICIAKLLCDFLFENNLVRGDNIVISELSLIQKLIDDGWDAYKAKMAINFLCSFDVKMVDDGEETDSFYIHF